MEIRRFTKSDTAITRQDDREYISGYGAVFYDGTPATEFLTPDGFAERISPDAFDDSLLSGEPLESRFNHSRDFVLGRSDLGTVRFNKDAKGLHYAVPFDSEDPDHQKVKAKIRKGLIRGSSFHGFVKKDDIQITRSDSRTILTIKKIQLKEAGPVDQPAYSGTDAVMRSDEIKRYVEDWEKAKSETEKRIKRMAEILL